MPLIFSYGSLREERVQLSTFGRLLDGAPDELVGFEMTSATVDDPEAVELSGRTEHANVVPSRADGRVAGMAFEITEAELARVDAYEARFRYRRIAVDLASGSPAWVYVYAPQ